MSPVEINSRRLVSELPGPHSKRRVFSITENKGTMGNDVMTLGQGTQGHQVWPSPPPSVPTRP